MRISLYKMQLLTFILTLFLFSGSKGVSLTPNPSVIIIGSGPAGIAAATRLLKHNFTNFKILEAENRIGGRINSVHFGDAFIDLGAEFCHGEKDNIVYSMAKDLDILKPSSENFQFFTSKGETVENDIAEEILKFADSLGATNETIPGCENVVSIGDCFDIKFKEFQETAKTPKVANIFNQSSDFITSHLCSYDSPFTLKDLSIYTDYKECEGNLHLNWNGRGYKTILEIMMQKFPNPEQQLPIDDKIYLQKEVINVNFNEEKVHVTTQDGEKFDADHVVFSPSLGVLKKNYGTLFEPQLPEEKVDAIKNVGFGAILKVFIHFPEKWWSGDANWALLWTEGSKETLKEKDLLWLTNISGFIQGENNPKVLISWFAGNQVPHIESLSDDQVMEGIKHLISQFLAPHFNVTMPDKILRTFWLSNPHFQGTYSYDSVKGHSTGTSKYPDKLAAPITNKNGKPTVLFAGEATHPYYFSTVHGAIESGHREADRILNLYQNNEI